MSTEWDDINKCDPIQHTFYPDPTTLGSISTHAPQIPINVRGQNHVTLDVYNTSSKAIVFISCSENC